MNVDTFLEARELYDKYQLCEKVMEYLSDEESVKGQKYLETLKQFVETFRMSFMMFVHERMEAVGMQFEDLKSCDCDKKPDVPAPPSEEKEPKFPIGSKVEVVDGKFKGRIGTVKDFDAVTSDYYVASDFNDNGTLFSMWFPESFLKSYVEDSEESSEPKFKVGDIVWVIFENATMTGTIVSVDDGTETYEVLITDGENSETIICDESELRPYDTEPETPEDEDEDDKYELVYGERVIVKSGEYAGKVGTIIDVMVGFTKILVGLDDVEDAVEFTPDQLAKYTDPENTEENGAGDTDTTEGE